MLIEGINITYLGHSCIKLKNGIIIYIDPYSVYDTEKADLILITHSHAENCSLNDIERLVKEDTFIVAPESCRESLMQLRTFAANKGDNNTGNADNIKYLGHGEHINLFGLNIVATEAYNVSFEKRFHVRGAGNGYVIETGNNENNNIGGNNYKMRIYYSGHTELVGEIKELLNRVGRIDVAFLSVNGTDTMNAEDAAYACDIIKPKYVIPVHFIPNNDEVYRFKELVNTAKVIVL